MMRCEWEEAMDEQEIESMKEFILYTFDGYKKFLDKDRFINHILYIMVREITRIVGVHKNLKISVKAEEILGECHSYRDIEKKKKAYPKKIVLDHDPPAKKFIEELEAKIDRKEDFTILDAEHWLKEVSIVAVTKNEDSSLTSAGYMSTRPPDAYDRLGIKKLDVWKY